VGAPLFSVVIPAFDAERTVEGTVRSVLAQTCSDFEVIVVDDGSRDGTGNLVRTIADSRVRLLRQENQGPAAARNLGVSNGQGRLLSFLDADDLYMPEYLEAMAAALSTNPQAGIAYSSAWEFDERVRRVSRRDRSNEPPADPADLLSTLLEENFIPTMATIPRAVLDVAGSFDARLARSEDYELWLRIAAHGYGVAYVPRRLAVYRVRPGSLSSSPLAMLSGLREVYRIAAEEYGLTEPHRQLALRRVAETERQLGPLAGDPGLRSRLLRARGRLRRRVGEARRRLLRDRLWYENPPPEVHAAFPELGS
jgi:glycosyltransferase involved in cell wall biosynthesis